VDYVWFYAIIEKNHVAEQREMRPKAIFTPINGYGLQSKDQKNYSMTACYHCCALKVEAEQCTLYPIFRLHKQKKLT